MTRQNARKIRRKRPPLSDGKWIRNIFALTAMTIAVFLTTIFLAGKLPELGHYIFDVLAQNNPQQDSPPVRSANERPSDRALPSRPESSVTQDNLQASVLGSTIEIVNEGEAPVHLNRLVQNKRYGVAWCDTEANVHSVPGESPYFPNMVNALLQIGDRYKTAMFPACGLDGVIEVYTDQGIAVFRLHPEKR